MASDTVYKDGSYTGTGKGRGLSLIHIYADGTVSGVVYNEMQGALATPDAQLQNALELSLIHI